MRKRLLFLALFLAPGWLAGRADVEASLSAARAALDAGRADDAIREIFTALSLRPGDGEAHNLLCRVYFAEERWDDAISECGKAVDSPAPSSDFHLWLGRAYGEKADRVSFVTAYSMAKQVRKELEAAVAEDPGNAAALSDLGEYYKSAPSMLGGGLDKAAAIADRLDAIDPARAHLLRAQIASGRKDLDAAERELKAAIQASPEPASYWANLANFYRRQERWGDMMIAIRHAGEDPKRGPALVEAAMVLLNSGREPALAAQMLEAYLASDNKKESAPAFAVLTRLARLKEQMGQPEDAARELAEARALARDYHPAQIKTNTGR